MSPVRPQARTVTEPSSATPRRRKGPSPSLHQPPFRPPPVDPAPNEPQADDESLPHPDALLRRSHGKVISPARSDESDEVLDLVARRPRPVATATALSPLASPTPSPRLSPTKQPTSAVSPTRNNNSPSPAARSPPPPRPRSPSPVIPPDPDPPLLPAGVRALRTRKPAQLRPYSLDQARYEIRLEKNGWEGAVVPLDRSAAARETPEELKRRKELQALRPKNHLGGWLVSDEEEYVDDEEEGDGGKRRQAKAGGGGASSQPSSSSMFAESLESEDGTTLLEREARRKERLDKAVAAGLVGNASKRSMLTRFIPHQSTVY